MGFTVLDKHADRLKIAITHQDFWQSLRIDQRITVGVAIPHVRNRRFCVNAWMLWIPKELGGSGQDDCLAFSRLLRSRERF